MSPVSETYVAHHRRIIEELTKLADGNFAPDDSVVPHELFAEALKALLSITLRLELYVVENFEGDLKKSL